MTVVEADKRCISACAILFMMGDRRDHIFVRIRPGPRPTFKAGRYLHYRGTLGFHAPRLELPPTAQDWLSPAMVSEAYARAIKTIASLVFEGGGLLCA
jgi:hypothetical protein